ncbi:MAG: hypothetical protein ACI97X_001987, partial [Oceanospirillaceae bacterium]
NDTMVRWIDAEKNKVERAKFETKPLELLTRASELSGFLIKGEESRYAARIEKERAIRKAEYELEEASRKKRRQIAETLERERTEAERQSINRSNTKSKSYASDGQTCTNCKTGQYFNGICSICSGASRERTNESYTPCSFCNGTGQERAANGSGSIVCRACDGKGKKAW